jgi:antagonist of KipI
MSVLVRSAGFLTSVQDLGRPGFRRSGVSVGGALDSYALRVANALVGNNDDAAGVEVTLGRLRVQFQDERLIAWCGGGFSVLLDEHELPAGRLAQVRENMQLTMAAPDGGGRAWLAISGGVDVPIVLGSRSTDLRGNFGGYEGRALRDGDVVPLGETGRLRERRLPGPGASEDGGSKRIAPWGAPAHWASIAPRNVVLRIVRGCDWNRFTPEAQRTLSSMVYHVMPDSDRMGVRLDGPQLDRIETGDLRSEAVAPGTLQVPPNGQPILLLGDCQTIGGYPKIAHVITVDLAVAAQLWPGTAVRFQEVSLDEAQLLLREREADFARFRVGLDLWRQ